VEWIDNFFHNFNSNYHNIGFPAKEFCSSNPNVPDTRIVKEAIESVFDGLSYLDFLAGRQGKFVDKWLHSIYEDWTHCFPTLSPPRFSSSDTMTSVQQYTTHALPRTRLGGKVCMIIIRFTSSFHLTLLFILHLGKRTKTG
jgi:hypothetical protein